MEEKHLTRNQGLGRFLFFAYLVLLVYVLFFSEMEERGILVKEEYTYNLRPFVEISRYLFHGDQIGFRGVLMNLWGNIIAFIPLGFTLPSFSRRCRLYWYNTLIVAYLLSYGIEMVQLVFRAGSCDVDDILLNSLGGLLGYLLFCFVQSRRSARYDRKYGKTEAL